MSIGSTYPSSISSSPFNSGLGSYAFGDEFAPPRKKASKEYGRQQAKAMYYSSNRYGYRLYNDNWNIQSLFEFAQGDQSIDNVYKMLGFFNDKGKTQDDNGSLAYIDVQVLNLITKYVNRTVAKLQRYKYDINFTAVDPISVDEQKQRNAKIKTIYELKNWYEKIQVNPQQYFGDIDLSVLPDYPDQLMFNMAANSKIKKIVDADKTLKLMTTAPINDLEQVMREFDWDEVVVGRGHIHCYLDENNIPRIKRVNPKFWGGSYVENEDYSKQEYAFFIDFITNNQFKKEAQGDLTKAEMEAVIGAHAFPNSAASYGSLPQYYENYDGLAYIPVMRFYYLSNDAVAYKIWNHSGTGNRMMDMTHYNYFPTENSQKEQKVVQNSYTSVYGGTWVIDSDTVYNYGQKPIPRSNLVNARLPIITFAPNMKEGRVVSMCSQMVEIAFQINVAWNRMKDILAKGRMGVLELNLTAIDQIALGKGGQKWTEREAIDFFMQSNIWLTRPNTNQYGQNVGKTIQEMNAGLQMADYLNTITFCIKLLDDLSSSSVIDNSQLPDRLTTGAMKANVQAGNDGLEYLINGHKKMREQVCHQLMLLTQQAKMNKAAIQGMIPALGTDTTEFFEVPDDLPYCDYGLIQTPAPSEEEWIAFFGEIMEAVREGRLNASDSAFIRQIKDMTLARYIMATREQANMAMNAKMNQQNQQFQMQSAAQAAQMKLQADMELLDKQKQNEIELKAIQARIDDALMTKDAMLKAEINKVSDSVKSMIAQQVSIDTILKEAIRAKSEDKKSDLQHQGKVITAQAQVATAMMNKDKKPKDKK